MQLLEDMYQILAELAVAFAGFAGVVAAFSTFRVPQQAVRLRVQFLVIVALTVLVGSLLPFVALGLGATEQGAIRGSAGFLGIGMTIVLVWAWRGLKPLYKARLIRTGAATTIIYLVSFLLIAAYFVVAAGGLADRAAALYVAGLFFGIVLCCWYFIMLMFAIDIGARG